MPDLHDDSAAGAPRPRRAALGRTLFLSIVAMAVGFLMAGKWPELWKDRSEAKRDFSIMNTYARITVPKESGSSLTPNELADLAEGEIRRVNDLMGPVGEYSDIRRLNEAKAGEWVEVDPRTWSVVMESLRWHRLSGGAFDPTIGPVKRLFRFDKSETERWPDEQELALAQARVGAEKLLFDREGMRLSWQEDGMRLDLGAIAKGFSADLAAQALIANGVRNALVNVGGELRVLGMKPGNPPRQWRAGVQNPRRGDILTEMDLSDVAVATSGDYENYFIYKGKRYEHIIDPRSKLPLTERVAGVTVVHPESCLAADALATTLCVLGPEEGRAFIEEQALGLFSKGVKVVMLMVDDNGLLRRRDITVDDKGRVDVADTDAEPARDGTGAAAAKD